MNTQKRDFDSESAQYDSNPLRVQMALDVANAIITNISLNSEKEILDFGCGTGLISTQLSKHVQSVTSMDSSQGMLSIVEQKITSQKLKNIRTSHIDLDQGDRLSGLYDLIICNMTLHHIYDINFLIGEFFRVLKKNGILCISDLDLEQGEFHTDNTGVFHFGFDRDFLLKTFADAGLTGTSVKTAASITKPSRTGIIKQFTIFMATGKKLR